MGRHRDKKRSRRPDRQKPMVGYGMLHTQAEHDQWMLLASQKAQDVPPACLGNTLMDPTPEPALPPNQPNVAKASDKPGNGNSKLVHLPPAWSRPPAWTNRFTNTGLPIPTLAQLLFMQAKDMMRFDVGFMNLLCATELPDTQGLDIEAVNALLDKLNEWADHVKKETDRNAHRCKSDSAKFNNSEAQWRVGMMITILQQDFGVHYDPACVEPESPTTSDHRFIHGLLQGKGGSCANMPVLYAAIGRRLGYPIYLCQARSHLFVRWQTLDGRERFNIEGSGQGFNAFPDDYYKNWPKSISELEVALGHFLRNLEPYDELALFMAERGHTFLDHGQWFDAVAAYAHAHRLAPADMHHFQNLLYAINEEIAQHRLGKLPGSFRELEAFSAKFKQKLWRRTLNDNFPRITGGHWDAVPNGPEAKRDK